jgi:hypothetical protein
LNFMTTLRHFLVALSALVLLVLSAATPPAHAQWRVSVSYNGDTTFNIGSGGVGARLTNFLGAFEIAPGTNTIDLEFNGGIVTPSASVSALPIFETVIDSINQGSGELSDNLNVAKVNVQWVGQVHPPAVAILTVACESGKKKQNLKSTLADAAQQVQASDGLTRLGNLRTVAPSFSPGTRDETVLSTGSFPISILGGSIRFELYVTQKALIEFGPRPESALRCWNAVRFNIN